MINSLNLNQSVEDKKYKEKLMRNNSSVENIIDKNNNKSLLNRISGQQKSIKELQNQLNNIKLSEKQLKDDLIKKNRIIETLRTKNNNSSRIDQNCFYTDYTELLINFKEIENRYNETLKINADNKNIIKTLRKNNKDLSSVVSDYRKKNNELKDTSKSNSENKKVYNDEITKFKNELEKYKSQNNSLRERIKLMEYETNSKNSAFEEITHHIYN